MDEQLIQQLVVQIDAQTAAMVQTHNAEAKSQYLWDTYPQVRACRNYYDAVVLLARERAALHVSPATNGFGTQRGTPPPTNVFGSQGVPQTGVPAAGAFTAFQPKPAAESGKVFGFIPTKIFAVIIIAVVAVIVIGGIAASIRNATNPKAEIPTETVSTTETDDPLADFFE